MAALMLLVGIGMEMAARDPEHGAARTPRRFLGDAGHLPEHCQHVEYDDDLHGGDVGLCVTPAKVEALTAAGVSAAAARQEVGLPPDGCYLRRVPGLPYGNPAAGEDCRRSFPGAPGFHSRHGVFPDIVGRRCLLRTPPAERIVKINCPNARWWEIV